MHRHPLTAYRENNGKMSLEALAEKFRVNKATVSRWERHGVPAKWIIEIERETGVPRESLRPDLYEAAS